MLIVLAPMFLMTLSWYILPVMAFVQIVLSWLLLAFIGRWTWRPRVLWTLSTMGHEVCVFCGYPLHGRRDGSGPCPECGRVQPANASVRDGSSSS